MCDAITPPRPPSERLAELVARARRSIEHSAHLVGRAKELCARSADATIASQRYHYEREAWARILARVPGDPDHKVVICARCRRAKGEERWTSMPAGVEHELLTWTG